MVSMNRREFLNLAVSAAAGASVAGSRAGAAADARRPLRKAVNLGMVKTDGSTLEKFKLLKELGFDGVELNRPGGPPADEILQARDATGLAVADRLDGESLNEIHWQPPTSASLPGRS